ncbi:MAG: TAXI family TRAP transporter solute-binding subunit [Dehalococcoidia bacterium]
MKRRLIFASLLVVVMIALLPACRKAAPAPAPAPAPVATPKPLPKTMTFAVMPVGSMTYVIGSIMTQNWTKYTGINVTPQPMMVGGPAFGLMSGNQLDMGITDAHLIAGGWQGSDYQINAMKFDPGVMPFPINVMNFGNALNFMFITLDPDIKTLEDFRGKKVYAEIPGAGTGTTVAAIFEAAGIKDDVEILSFPVISEAQRGLVEGKADILWYGVAPFIAELSQTHDVYPIPIPVDVVERAAAAHPEEAISASVWPKGLFGNKQDVPVWSIPFGLYVHEDTDPDVVYLLMQTFYANYDEMVAAHAWLTPWSLDNAISVQVAPVHPGAIRYFKEQGIWTAENEQKNQQFLAMR